MKVAEFDRRACLRFRCRTFPCDRCAEECPSAAITFSPFPALRADHCSGCGLCAASCPAQAIVLPGHSLGEILERLRGVARPILGCATRPAAQAHARVSCFGALAPEDLFVLAGLGDGRVCLDASGCTDCPNAFVLDRIATNIRRSECEHRIVLTREPEAVPFRSREWDRRSFVRWVKDRVAAPSPPPEVASPGKKPPQRLRLLHEALARRDGECRDAARAAFESRIDFDSSCDHCGRCASMCPTGALIRLRLDTGRRMVAQPDQCTGCGLCVHFCSKDALHVTRARSSDSGRSQTAWLPELTPSDH